MQVKRHHSPYTSAEHVEEGDMRPKKATQTLTYASPWYMDFERGQPSGATLPPDLLLIS